MRIHGHARNLWTPEYRTWSGIIQRCCNPCSTSYPDYGGRGIKICMKWRTSFTAFLDDVGYKPSPKHSIDRYPDNDGDYRPGNVRWATRSEQMRNTRVCRLFTHDGITATLGEWAERTGISRATLFRRIARGVPLDVALFQAPLSRQECRALGTAKWKELTRKTDMIP